MDFGAVLFAFGLLMAGMWLIFSMSRDLKDKNRRTQQEIEVALQQRRPTNGGRASTAGRARALSRPPAQVALALKATRQGASPARGETGATADQLQNLNAAFVRETFEKFIRK